MIRYTLLTCVVVGLLIYIWRDWYKGLCGLILFMAIYARPDMPSEMFGIPGINPFNLLLLNVGLAWLAKRQQEKRRWELPGHLNVLLLLYLGVIVIAVLRMIADPRHLHLTGREMLIEYIVNCAKWVVPGLLLFDGCRSRERFYWAMFAILGVYVLLALQVARKVLPSLDVSELERRGRKIIGKEIGYHRVDMATMLAGAAWGLFATRELFRRHRYRTALLAASGLVVYALLLTAGRAGYASFIVIGAVMCSVRWKRYLVLGPILALVVVVAFPSVVGRMFEGIHLGGGMMPGDSEVNETEVMASRNFIWPIVIDRIKENPVIGYGREAHNRLGIGELARQQLQDEEAGHPHNAYLELLLDNGILGFLPIMAYFVLVLRTSFTLFCDTRSPISIAAGGTALACTLAWMGGSLGAQSFYPRESTVPMWCAMMLAFRVELERSRVLARNRAARPGPRTRVRTALSWPAPAPVAEPKAPVAIGAYARRRPRTRQSWDVALMAEPPSPLDSQLWARSPGP